MSIKKRKDNRREREKRNRKGKEEGERREEENKMKKKRETRVKTYFRKRWGNSKMKKTLASDKIYDQFEAPVKKHLP